MLRSEKSFVSAARWRDDGTKQLTGQVQQSWQRRGGVKVSTGFCDGRTLLDGSLFIWLSSFAGCTSSGSLARRLALSASLLPAKRPEFKCERGRHPQIEIQKPQIRAFGMFVPSHRFPHS